MAAIHVRMLSTTALSGGVSAIRARLLATEAPVGNYPNMRARFAGVEAPVGNYPNMRARFTGVEINMGTSTRNMRTRMCVVEALQKILEPQMATLVFPSLIGLAFDVGKAPIFSTGVAEHTSGEETATSYYQNPKWQFTLTYDYLPDLPKSVGDTDLHTLMGFFMQCRGRGSLFLFQDPDQYIVDEGFQADFDGTVVDFDLVRGTGAFYEPVGQLDTNVALDVWLAVTESTTIPATPGPYTVTVSQAADYHQTDSVLINGVAATQVPSAPTTGQYAVAAGVYTFAAADQSDPVDIRYRYLVDPADYTVTMPNRVAFDTAPPDLATAYASFQYFYQCRFLEDMSDYKKFMHKLWELNELAFRSVPT